MVLSSIIISIGISAHTCSTFGGHGRPSHLPVRPGKCSPRTSRLLEWTDLLSRWERLLDCTQQVGTAVDLEQNLEHCAKRERQPRVVYPRHVLLKRQPHAARAKHCCAQQGSLLLDRAVDKAADHVHLRKVESVTTAIIAISCRTLAM